MGNVLEILAMIATWCVVLWLAAFAGVQMVARRLRSEGYVVTTVISPLVLGAHGEHHGRGRVFRMRMGSKRALGDRLPS